METALLELQDVVQRYGQREALRVESLRLEPGAILGVAGPNGAGKSTLLKIMALLERPARGRVLFRGKPLDRDLTRARRQVTMLQQSPFLLTRTVFDNLVYGLKVRGDTKYLSGRAAKALARVGLKPEFLSRKSGELSGGEAQRVALAARLLLEPRALLLDEPTASLDEESRLAILEAALAARHEHGTAVCIVSHDRDWLEEVSDSVLTLHQGRAVGFGRINVLHGPWTPENGTVAMRLNDGQILPGPEKPPLDAGSGVLLPATAVRPLADGEAPAPGEARLLLCLDRSVLIPGRVRHLRFSAPGLSLWCLVPADAPSIQPGCKTAVAVRTTEMRWE